MTRRHLRNIERTDARRARPITFNESLERFKRLFAVDRRDCVWPDAVETPASGTETGRDGDEGGGSVSVEGSYHSEALNVLSGIARSSPRHSGKTLAMSREVERMIAEAVAREREAIARWMESIILSDWAAFKDRAWRPDFDLTGWDVRVIGHTPASMIDAIRAGAHNEGGE